MLLCQLQIIPDIKKLLRKLGDCKLFSLLDLLPVSFHCVVVLCQLILILKLILLHKFLQIGYLSSLLLDLVVLTFDKCFDFNDVFCAQLWFLLIL